jgi:mannose/fructose/N-acetylgalactosamine-specific phosphotransferase system component IID
VLNEQLSIAKIGPVGGLADDVVRGIVVAVFGAIVFGLALGVERVEVVQVVGADGERHVGPRLR